MDLTQAIDDFVQSLKHLSVRDRSHIIHAIDVAEKAHDGQTRSDGTPYFSHPLAVASLLVQWGADTDTIIAGLLHDTLEDTDLTNADIAEQFGDDVEFLVEGITKFSQADFVSMEMDRKVETLRKLFEVMRFDIRAAIVKLADRVHNIQTIDSLPEDRQKRFARETLDIYYKLAEHLGMNDVRRIFSNICIPILEPEVSQKMLQRQEELMDEAQKLCTQLTNDIEAHDIDHALISLKVDPHSLSTLTRKKSIEQGDEFPFVFTAIGRDRDACYDLLKIFHTLYRPISGRFRDYIAVPMENSYETIRTSVIGPHNNVLPIRIRTEQMDMQERRGILLKCFTDDEVPGFSWLERSASIDESTRESSHNFWEALQSEILEHHMAVSFNGEELSVPLGSTILDATYARLGHDANRLLSVTINGNPVELSQILKEDDVILAHLDARNHVDHEWLRWVTTSNARRLIVNSLKQRSKHEKLTLGQHLLQKELDRFRKGLIGELSRHRQEEVAAYFEQQTFEDVVSMVGEGILPARDVVFHLFPEQKLRRFPLRRKHPKLYRFHLRIRASAKAQQSPLPQVIALSRIHDTVVRSTKLRLSEHRHTIDLYLRGFSRSRNGMALFLNALERESDIADVRSLLTIRERIHLMSIFCLGFLIIAADIFLVFFFGKNHPLPPLLENILPLIPIFFANHLVLHHLQYYMTALRNDRLYIGLAFFVNICGLLLLIGLQSTLGIQQNLIPLITVFILSMFYIGYRFLKAEEIFKTVSRQTGHELSPREWKRLKKNKIIGYAFRTGAVLLWGIDPLLHKYTPAGSIDPLIRLPLLGIGVLLITGSLFLIQWILHPSKTIQSLRIPKDIYFYNIIIGMTFFRLLLTVSLLYTTSTNFILFNNFSPVIALLIAMTLWRGSIPYLRNPKTMLAIFVIFITGSMGSTLIIFNTLQTNVSGSIVGDLVAISAMAMDTLLVVSQIQYMKRHSKISSAAISLHVFSLVTITSIPIVVYLIHRNPELIENMDITVFLYGISTGVLLGVGQIFNYEAFRRVDGFIAFLMFNISILITFIIEVVFLDAFTPTPLLLLGGIIIIGSTIVAELINGHCQRKGL